MHKNDILQNPDRSFLITKYTLNYSVHVKKKVYKVITIIRNFIWLLV